MVNHPRVTPKDQVDDVVHYLRYVAKFAPPVEDAPPNPTTPRWYWFAIASLAMSATTAAFVLAMWVTVRMILKF